MKILRETAGSLFINVLKDVRKQKGNNYSGGTLFRIGAEKCEFKLQACRFMFNMRGKLPNPESISPTEQAAL